MLKKIINPDINPDNVNILILFLRLAVAITMMVHGYGKINHFSEYSGTFMRFLGLSGPVSLSLLIGAEFFCSIFIGIGLFTRFALIPLIIAMLIALFKAHHGELFGDGEMSFLYLACYISLFISGPGKFSLDFQWFKK